jgi:hypothetical protein
MPRRRPRQIAYPLLVAIGSLVLGGCLVFAGRHWDATRVATIEPINRMLHHHLARHVAARDLALILSLYATERGTGLTWNAPVAVDGGAGERRLRWEGPAGPEAIRARYEALLALFPVIEHAAVRIHRVDWSARDALGFPAEVRMLVHGRGGDGQRQMLDQWARVHVDAVDDAWVVTGEEVTRRELVTSVHARFEDTTSVAGIEDVHASGGPEFRLLGDLTVSSGVAVADIDCDGWEDVALLDADRVTFYLNRGDGTFARGERPGLQPAIDVVGSGLVFFDSENDGDPDLFVCGLMGDRLFRNDECGTFVDRSAAAGLGPSTWSSMPVVADYDGDGFLDVYVIRMGDHAGTAPKPSWEARNGTADTLYHNNGDGTFADVTEAAGIRERGWGLAGAWGDYNDDGRPDLYVGNEFGLNSLYRNEGDGTFTNVAAEAEVLDRGAAMGVSWGDYDNDGDLDLFVNNMYPNSRWALFHPDFPPPVPWYLRWVPRSEIHRVLLEITRGSTLLRNDGDGSFTDVSEDAGVRDCQWGWAAEFLDYDNDGRLDIYCTNGFVSGPIKDDI